MLLAPLLLVIGGLRAQQRASRERYAYGTPLLVAVGTAVVFAIVVHAGGVRDLRVVAMAGAGLLVAALLYGRAYRHTALRIVDVGAHGVRPRIIDDGGGGGRCA